MSRMEGCLTAAILSSLQYWQCVWILVRYQRDEIPSILLFISQASCLFTNAEGFAAFFNKDTGLNLSLCVFNGGIEYDIFSMGAILTAIDDIFHGVDVDCSIL